MPWWTRMTENDPIWICDCGAINESHWATCPDCQEYKPRPCDDCGTEFVPWSETSKGNARAHKYQCRRCWLVSDNLSTTEP